MEFVRSAQKFHFLALEGGEAKTRYARLAFENAIKGSREPLTATELQRAKHMLPKALLRPFLLRGGNDALLTIRDGWKGWGAPASATAEQVVLRANQTLDSMVEENGRLTQQLASAEAKLAKAYKCDDARVAELTGQLEQLTSVLNQLRDLDDRHAAWLLEEKKALARADEVERDYQTSLRLFDLFEQARDTIYAPYFSQHKSIIECGLDLCETVDEFIVQSTEMRCEGTTKSPQLETSCGDNIPPIITTKEKIGVYNASGLQDQFLRLMRNFNGGRPDRPSLRAAVEKSRDKYMAWLKEAHRAVLRGEAVSMDDEPEMVVNEEREFSEGLDADALERLIRAISSADQLSVVKACDECDVRDFAAQDAVTFADGDETIYVHGTPAAMAKGLGGIACDVVVREMMEGDELAEITHPKYVKEFLYIDRTAEKEKYIDTSDFADPLEFPTGGERPVRVFPSEDDTIGRYTPACRDVALRDIEYNNVIKVNGIVGLKLGDYDLPVFNEDGTLDRNNIRYQKLHAFAYRDDDGAGFEFVEPEDQEPFVFHLLRGNFDGYWKTIDHGGWEYYNNMKDGKATWVNRLRGMTMPEELRNETEYISYNTKTGVASSIRIDGDAYRVRMIREAPLAGGKKSDAIKSSAEFEALRDAQDWDTLLEEMKKVEPGESGQLDEEMQQWLTRNVALNAAAYDAGSVDAFLGKDTYIKFYKLMKHPLCFAPEEKGMSPVQRRAIMKACKEDSTWPNVVDYLDDVAKMDAGMREAVVAKMKELLQDEAILQSDSDLPPGWHRAMSKGEQYYWKDDGTSQWEKPVDLERILDKLRERYEAIEAAECENIDVEKANALIQKLEKTFPENEEAVDMVYNLTNILQECETIEAQKKEMQDAIDKMQGAECEELDDDFYESMQIVTQQFEDYDGYMFGKVEEELERLKERMEACKDSGKVEEMLADAGRWLEQECDKSDDWQKLHASYRESLLPYAEKFPDRADEINDHLEKLRAAAEACGKRKEELLDMQKAIDNLRQASGADCESTDDWQGLFEQYKASLLPYAEAYPEQKEMIDGALGELETHVTRCTEERRKKQQEEEARKKRLEEDYARIAAKGCAGIEDPEVEKYIEELRAADDPSLPQMLEYVEKCRASNEAERMRKEEEERKRKEEEERRRKEEEEERRRKAEEEERKRKAEEERKKKLEEDYNRAIAKGCEGIESPEVTQYMEQLREADDPSLPAFMEYVEKCRAANEKEEEERREKERQEREEEERRKKKEREEEAKRRKAAKKRREIEDQKKKLIDEYKAIDWNCDNISSPAMQKYKEDLRKSEAFAYMYDNLERYERDCEKFKDDEKKRAEFQQEAARRKKDIDDQREKLLDDYEKIKGVSCTQVDSPDVQKYMEDVSKADQNIFGSLKDGMREWEAKCRAENAEKKSTHEMVAKTVCAFDAVPDANAMNYLSTQSLGAVVESARSIANGRLVMDVRLPSGARKKIIEVRNVSEIRQPAEFGASMQIVCFATDGYDIEFAQEVQFSSLLTWTEKKRENAFQGGGAAAEDAAAQSLQMSTDSGSYVWSMTGGGMRVPSAEDSSHSFSGDLIHLDDIMSSSTSSSSADLPSIRVDLNTSSAAQQTTKLYDTFW